MIYCSRCLSRGRLIRVSSARLKVGYRTCASCGPKLRIGRKPVGRDVWFCRKRECSSRLSRTRVSAGLCYCRRHGISIKKTSRPKFIDARHTLATPRLLRPRQAIRVASMRLLHGSAATCPGQLPSSAMARRHAANSNEFATESRHCASRLPLPVVQHRWVTTRAHAGKPPVASINVQVHSWNAPKDHFIRKRTGVRAAPRSFPMAAAQPLHCYK